MASRTHGRSTRHTSTQGHIPDLRMPSFPTNASVNHLHAQAQRDTSASTERSSGPVEAHIVRIPSTRALSSQGHTLSSRLSSTAVHGHSSSPNKAARTHDSHIPPTRADRGNGLEYITRGLSRLTTTHTPTSSSHRLQGDEVIAQEIYTQLSRFKIDAIEQGDSKQIACISEFESLFERALRSRGISPATISASATRRYGSTATATATHRTTSRNTLSTLRENRASNSRAMMPYAEPSKPGHSRADSIAPAPPLSFLSPYMTNGEGSGISSLPLALAPASSSSTKKHHPSSSPRSEMATGNGHKPQVINQIMIVYEHHHHYHGKKASVKGRGGSSCRTSYEISFP